MAEFKIASLTQKHGTPLTTEDIKNICEDIRNGMSYVDVRKKYTIGGGRLARILKICNVKSIVRGGWENMNPIDVHLSRDCNGNLSSSSGNITTGRGISKEPSKVKNEPDNLDSLLTKQVEAMKKNMESIKFKSFID